MFFCNWNNYNSISIDIACRSFGIPSSKDGDVTGNTIAKTYEDGNISGIEEDVMRDAAFSGFSPVHSR